MKLYTTGQFINLFLALILVSVVLSSCNETYTPRPKGYFRIALPEKKYSLYDGGNCAFKFELPQYSQVVNYKDSIAQPCWKYIRFPQLNGEIFLSYKEVNNNV